MTALNIGTLVGKVYDLVQGLEKENQEKVFKAAFALCGLEAEPQTPGSTKNANGVATLPSKPENASAFFAQKKPESKVESLTVAARYREQTDEIHEHSKSDFEALFSSARRNFDSKNFSQDMKNAKIAGLFVKGGKKAHSHKLSYAGQNFVDSLPDRKTADAFLKKPRSKGTKKKKHQPKATKTKTK